MHLNVTCNDQKQRLYNKTNVWLTKNYIQKLKVYFQYKTWLEIDLNINFKKWTKTGAGKVFSSNWRENEEEKHLMEMR